MRMGRSLKITRLGEGIVSLQIATDETPYLGHWYVPILSEAVERLKADESIRVVLVEGGDRYFSAGASREALLSSEPEAMIQSYVGELPRLLLSVPVPTVAAMAGHAIGGGFVLGLWCDIVVLAEESLYGANFMALGFTPGMGATVVVEEVLGAPFARELLLTGRLVKGHELRSAGGAIARYVVPRAEVRSRALAIAEEIAEAPRVALVQMKRTLANRRRELLERAIREEGQMQSVLFASEETRSVIASRYVRADEVTIEGDGRHDTNETSR